MHLGRLAALGGAFFAISAFGAAHAAVSVIGSGPAELCYHAADSGDAPAENLIYCNAALGGPLSRDDRAATLVNRGVLRLALNQPEQAADDFNASIAINANIGESYVDLGATQIFAKNYQAAIDNITRGLKLGSKQPQNAYYDRAVANEALGRYKEAYDDYRQALDLAPGFALAAEQLKRFKLVDKPSGT